MQKLPDDSGLVHLVSVRHLLKEHVNDLLRDAQAVMIFFLRVTSLLYEKISGMFHVLLLTALLSLVLETESPGDLFDLLLDGDLFAAPIVFTTC